MKKIQILTVTAFILTLSITVSAQDPSSRPRLPHGYLIVQDLSVCEKSEYGAISTVQEADRIFDDLKGKLDALEFNLNAYGEGSLRAARVVAESAKRHGIELWTTTWNLTNNIHIMGVPIPQEYLAYVMEPDGTIVQAKQDWHPVFDVLNPEAMDWFLKRYKEIYIKPFRGLTQGLMFNEDMIPYLGSLKNDFRPDYRRNPTFSPRVLALWKYYCRKHNVRYNGRLVERFPVHKPEMVSAGKAQTECFPGYDVPEQVFPGQRFVDLPRAKDVWRHWQEFIAEQFANNWIGRLAKAFNEVNKDNPRWYGALYFASFQRCLPYEQVRNKDFSVPEWHQWGTWGLQHGCDLERIARLPDIDVIACETFPPIRANLEQFIAEYARITRDAGKQFGVMLHADYVWPIGTQDSEEDRWNLIRKYQPDVIMRIPKEFMRPGDGYNATQEQIFNKEWQRYRETSRLKLCSANYSAQ